MAKRVILTSEQVEKILNAYVYERDNVSNIQRRFNVSTKIVYRILRENNIKRDGIKNRFYRTLTLETKNKISNSLMGKPSPLKGLSYNLSESYKLNKLEKCFKLDKNSLIGLNFEKIRFISKWIIHGMFAKKAGYDYVKEFLFKFYYDEAFNKIYDNWKLSGLDKWWQPTLEHKLPISRGGDKYDLNNLEILTWFENKIKSNMTTDEWEIFKAKTKTTSLLFK